MPKADQYLSQIDPCRYWPADAPVSCDQFIRRFQEGEPDIDDYPFLTPRQLQAYKLVLKAERYLPETTVITLPQPMEAGLFPVNDPGWNDLVIVSGNSSLTFEVLTSVWAQGVTPAYFLLLDCLGNTVDMAMIYGNFTPVELNQAIKKNNLAEKVTHRRLIVPGLTAPLAEDFREATGWEIEAGPICAVELPLYLDDRWMFPGVPYVS